jgi:DMSO/TMAO reductase YedYZ molybdopterin-dependent catalytic subunit
VRATSRRGAGGRWPAALAGVAAAAAGVAVAELAAGVLPGGRSLFVAGGEAIIRLTPAVVVNFAIATFRGANRLVLLLSMSVGLVVAGALLGLLTARRRWAGPVGFAAAAALGGAAGVADPLMPPVTAVGVSLSAAGTAAALLWWLLGRPGAAVIEPITAPNGDGGRRAFLAWVVVVGGGAVVLGTVGRFRQHRALADAARRAVVLPVPKDPLPAPPIAASFQVDGISPLITPNDRFYRIDTALTVPRIDPRAHHVRFTGMIRRPFEISYDGLLRLADTEADVTLACVSNEVGGHLVGNARWFGVPLPGLLERAGVQPDATQVVGRAVDGWTAGFPVAVALDGRPALVAVGMNGEPLPDRHGFPCRLVVGGLYGYVSDTKWLSEIELTTFEAYDAYWIQRGWAREGPIKTQSRIDVPRANARLAAGSVPVAGVAWAGERAISRVEVAVDDVWRPAELAEPLADTTWRQWRYQWAAGPGEHTLRVRATDGEGHTQTAAVTPPAPDGATGHHTITVHVI